MTVSYITALGWPFFGALGLLAFPAMRMLYGDQWDLAVDATRILALGMALWLPGALCQHILIARGQAPRVLRLMLMSTVVQVLLIAAGAWTSLLWAAAGFAAGQCASVVIWIVGMRRVVPFRWRALVAVLSKSGVVAAMALLAPLLTIGWYGWEPVSRFAPLLSATLGTGLLFVLALWLTGHPLWSEVRRLFGKARSRARSA
jgi:O-antigen/teichoic acid export membrane protein